MIAIETLLLNLQQHTYDRLLLRTYCVSDTSVTAIRSRMEHLCQQYQACFQKDSHAEIEIFSAPGRTELGGNHTDHQHGCVLAASVNRDILAAAAPNGKNTIRIYSEGFDPLTIDLSVRTPQQIEYNTSAALVRGVAVRLFQMGFPISGFDAYFTSTVLKGSGISSSAAYEVLLGVIMNRFFCAESLSAIQIAQIGQFAENTFFGKPSGLMDQMACSIGGIVAIDFANPQIPLIRQIPFHFAQSDFALCLVDCGANHADLTPDYAAIPAEMSAVAHYFGKTVLREVCETDFWTALPQIRQSVGDRALLRAIHFFSETKRANDEAQALQNQNLSTFLNLVRLSGQSSYMLLQNISTTYDPKQQSVAVALAIAQHVLQDHGAYRIHGGGFAGTIQAFVPFALLSTFQNAIANFLDIHACHVMSIRPVGGIPLITE